MVLKDLKKGDKFRFENDEKVFTVEHVSSRRFQYGNLKDTIALSLVNPPDVLFKEVVLMNDMAQSFPINQLEFAALVNPLMDWFRSNYNKSTCIIITYDGAKLLSDSLVLPALPEHIELKNI